MTPSSTPIAEAFQTRGFAILGQVVSNAELAELREEANRLLETSPERAGFRHGLQQSERFRKLAHADELRGLAAEILGEAARPVKLTGFDKTPDANWRVPWHQDLTITVRERKEVPGFGPWSTKGGLPHVQPSDEVLAGIVALRLHLDDTSEKNGALLVIPDSHRKGKLSREEIRKLAAEEPCICPVPEGAAMLMSPLLLHASSVSSESWRRRVLHFEYAAADLPGGLQWL